MLGVALAVLGEPPGYANLFLRYGLMGAFMAVPMAAMLAPMFALVISVELGVAGYVPVLSEESLMMLSHVAMIAGMVVLMIYRLERYAYGSQGHCP